MKIRHNKLRSMQLVSAIAIATSTVGVGAQPTETTASQPAGTAAISDVGLESNDIVVTARRRTENLISVPVTVTAITRDQISARGINSLNDIAKTIPQLIIGGGGGSFQGGTVALRGIGANDGNNFGDQAVGFYIDGVLVARSTPRQMAELDLQQVEVLKGPQALYYGKNSPGGVVVLRSADPGDAFDVGGNIGYEFKAHQIRGQAYISAPLTDSFGVRLAFGGATMRGWAKNIATPSTIYTRTSKWEPSDREINGRATFKFDNGGPFKARLKIAYGDLENSGPSGETQLVNCVLGFPQTGPSGPNDCRADNRTVHVNLGTRFGTGGINTVTGSTITGDPLFRDGKTFGRFRQILSGVEMNYQLSDRIALSSITGYYRAHTNLLDDFLQHDSTFPFNPVAGAAGTGGFLAAYNDLTIREISQELRLTSSFDGPLNLMLGGYFQDQSLQQLNGTRVNAVNPIALGPPARTTTKGTTYSAFVSVSYKPVEQVELSGGLRYTHEEKQFGFFRLLPGVLPASQGGGVYSADDRVPTLVPKRIFHNVSPEAVLSWRPTERLTAYVSWKRGFISGGFNPAASGGNVAILPDRSYDQQVVEGFEGGMKALLFAETLRTNFAVFDYKINGLQVSRANPADGSQSISNAASARSKGLEVDATFKTPLKYLRLNGAIAYTNARYLRYNTSPCFGGQSIAEGCNLGLNGTGTAFTQQDLRGAPLPRAAKWAAALGADYERHDAAGNLLGLSLDGNYSSKFYTDGGNAPGGIQKAYWLFDASARYKMQNGTEIALIGRNLTNKYYFLRSSAATFTGSGTGSLVAVHSDMAAVISRPREIWVRLGYKFR